MSIAQQIADRLISIRKKRGLSAVALGEKTGISKARISHWETAKRKPSIEDAKLLAKVLKISPAFLLCLTDKDENYCVDNIELPIFQLSENKLEKLESKTINISSLIDVAPLSPLVSIVLSDDSMCPIFRKRDLVTFIKANKAQHNDYVLIETANGVFFRRFFIDTSDMEQPKYCFKPENDEWPVISTINKTSFTIIGYLKDYLRIFI